MTECGFISSDSFVEATDVCVDDTNVHIRETEEGVLVEYHFRGVNRSIEFNRVTGVTKLDGRRCLGAAQTNIYMHPIMQSGLFESFAFLKRMVELLNLSEVSFEWGSSYANAGMLIAANRFIDYPSSFFNGLKEDLDLLLNICDPCSGIPRHVEELKNMYELTGLPNDQSIKNLLFNDLLQFCSVLVCPDIPFKNPKTICRFLNLPRDHIVYSSLIESSPDFSVCRNALTTGLRIIAEEKGDAAVLDFLCECTERELYAIFYSMEGGYWMDSAKVRSLIAKTPLPQLSELLVALEDERNNPGLIDKEYSYDERIKSLEFERGDFKFKLPKAREDVLEAALTVGNGFDLWSLNQDDDGLVVLISKKSEIVGIAIIECGNELMHARISNDSALEFLGGLRSAFRCWCKACDLDTTWLEWMCERFEMDKARWRLYEAFQG